MRLMNFLVGIQQFLVLTKMYLHHKYNRIINVYDVKFMQDGVTLFTDRVEHGSSAYYYGHSN